MCFQCEKTFITDGDLKRIYTGENLTSEIQINSKMEFFPKEQYLKVLFLFHFAHYITIIFYEFHSSLVVCY